jgi:hypothetical protein
MTRRLGVGKGVVAALEDIDLPYHEADTTPAAMVILEDYVRAIGAALRARGSVLVGHSIGDISKPAPSRPPCCLKATRAQTGCEARGL